MIHYDEEDVGIYRLKSLKSLKRHSARLCFLDGSIHISFDGPHSPPGHLTN